MKRVVLSIIVVLFCIITTAQVPESFNYQAIVRDGGDILSDQTVSYRFSIIKGALPGEVVYTEKHSITTNEFGLVNLSIGKGTDKTGDFTLINWGADSYSLKIEIDLAGGDVYTDMGTTQLLSVPFAIYSKKAGTADYNNLSNLPNLSGYLTSETDPVFGVSPAQVISNGNITNWNTAYGWGDHAGLYRPISYVPSWTEITSNPTTISGYGITDAVITSGNQIIAGDKTFSNKIIATQQGIGTSTPSAGAALEISSTTQGFLPPRMTLAQRDAIAPVEGLIIYNTTTQKPNYYDGTQWRNWDGTLAVLAIGSSYQGGIIAYILQSGDPGYDANVLHGLIAAPYDQCVIIEWYNGSYTTTGATATELGSGNANTIIIVNSQGVGNYAAKLCNDLVLNGYSDWYLPSKDELNTLYLNKVATGGFLDDGYWSSTESDNSNAWFQGFGGGSQLSGNKNLSAHVRAVRSF